MRRRLSAILAADVVGYTRLMGADEIGTLRRLKAQRAELLEPLISDHSGRIVKLMGDGLLIEFSSVVDAVNCAVAWQQNVARQEQDPNEDTRLQYRIGVNLGDVIADDNDIYGEGVNVAVRLEGLAEPGGIYLSGDVYRQVKGKIDANFEDQGEQEVKNVTEPVRVYRIVAERSPETDKTQELSTMASETSDAALRAARQVVALDPLNEASRRQYMVLLAQSGNRAEAIRQYEICADLLHEELGTKPDAATQELLEQIRRSQPHTASISQIGKDERQDLIDTPATADRPVIAVMPFANLGDDPEFAFMVDGLAEDLVFALSAFRSFRVLARTATFRMRETDMCHSDIQRVFGASYAVNGRVRRSGARLRVSVELIDCTNGEQLWSNRYDKNIDDLFDVEEDISRRIAAAIEPTLENVEMRRALARPPETLEAYELLQRGYWHLYRATPDDEAEAWRCIKAAIGKDPTYAEALTGLAHLKFRDAHSHLMDNFDARMEDCRATAAQALELDPRNPRALRFLSGADSALGNHEVALEAARRAVELCPSFAQGYSGLAFVQDFIGNFSDAKPAADETIRLRPHDPVLHRCVMSKSIAEYQTEQYERAERVARDSLRTNDSWWLSNMMLAACLGKQGRMDEAKATIDRMRTGYHGLKLEVMLHAMPFADPAHSDHLAEGLLEAGWRD